LVSLLLREEHRLKGFETGVLRRTFGPKGNKERKKERKKVVGG